MGVVTLFKIIFEKRVKNSKFWYSIEFPSLLAHLRRKGKSWLLRYDSFSICFCWDISSKFNRDLHSLYELSVTLFL